MIRKVGEQISQVVLDKVGRVASQFQEHRLLPPDLLEGEDAYMAVFDAPGATPNDITVHFEGNTLSVQIDRYREFRKDFEMRFPGRGLTMDGEVELPAEATVDPDRADATLTQSGTVEILIPKRPLEDETDTEA